MNSLPRATALSLALVLLASPAAIAQEGWGVAADLGVGLRHAPDWPGAADMDTSPWLILRNVDLTKPGESVSPDGSAQGLAILPTWRYRAGRDSGDSAVLAGLDDIDPAIELGAGVKYTLGNAAGYAGLRKGFGGHHGIAGEFGAKYRLTPAARLTLWAGAEAEFGNDDFTSTFFGVTSAESAGSDYAAYAPDGGIYAHAVFVEGRYALTDRMAIVGEAKYSKLTGDAADSPFVQDTAQPSVRLGLVHRFSFRF